MKRWKRGVGLTLVLALLVTLLSTARAAGNVYLTSINDSLLELSIDTMPTWSGGVLYVPYTAFDGNYTGISLGINSSYSREGGTVTLYNLQQMLVFDLNRGTCYDSITGESLSGRAILRNGRPYVPIGVVCSFFGLSYSVIDIDEGYIVRIKSSGVVLSDASFVDAAQNSIRSRLRDYYQASQSQPTPGVLPPTTSSGGSSDSEEPETDIKVPDDPVDTDVIPTYLAFRCEDSQGLGSILDELDRNSQRAVFLFSAEELEREDDLLYRILGSGHSVGLIAQGNSTAATRRQLEQANETLAQVGYTRTSIALVPESQRAELEKEGWICWDETASAPSAQGANANTYANQVLNRIDGNRTRVYLTLEADSETARVLPTLLWKLSAEGYGVSVPLETRL